MLRPLTNDLQDLYIVAGTPFIYISSSNTLVMSDLHLGFEEAASRGLFYSLRRGGGYYAVFVPKIQLRRTISMLDHPLNKLKIERVVINGDLKHAFDRLLRQEKEEVIELIKYLREKGVIDVIVIRGNHDNFIKAVLGKLDVKIVSAISIRSGGKRVIITHGHEKYSIEDHDIVIIGHEHPSLRCFDIYKFPSFLKIPFNDGKTIIVMPATSPYHPGVSVSTTVAEYLSPYIKEHGDLENMSIIIWIDLGEISKESVDYMISTPLQEYVRIDRFIVNSREVAIIEFKNYVIAQLICQV
ncbi:MAG: metallophosphoesterase [Desulfurococcaceae archaeon]